MQPSSSYGDDGSSRSPNLFDHKKLPDESNFEINASILPKQAGWISAPPSNYSKQH